MTGNFNSTTFAYSPPAGFETVWISADSNRRECHKTGRRRGDAVVIIDATTKGPSPWRSPMKTGIGLRPLPMITMCYTSAMIASPLLTDHILLHNIFLALNALLPAAAH